MRTAVFSALIFALSTIVPSHAIAQVCVGAGPSPCLGVLVISELTFSGPGGASDEFVEIYNRGPETVDASGVEIVYASAGSTTLNARATLPASTSIPPRSFYLATSTSYAGATTPDLFGWSIGFSSSGGAVALRAGTTVLDLVGWGSPLLSESTPIGLLHGAGGSFERKAKASSTLSSMQSGGIDELEGNAFDSDDNALDFVVRPTSEPQNSASPFEPPLPVPSMNGRGLISMAALLVVVAGLALRRSLIEVGAKRFTQGDARGSRTNSSA